jgi:WD40 repeat protein
VAAAAATVGFVNADQQRRRAEEQTRIAVSRQLLAESTAMQSLQPGLARQLMAVAYRSEPTDQAYGSLLQSAAMPGALQFADDVNAVTYAPDGRTIAIAYGNRVTFVNPGTDAVVSTAISFNVAVSAMAFDRTGRRFAAASADGSVGIYDTQDPGHPREVGRSRGGGATAQLALSADGRILATAERGQTIRVWNLDRPGDLSPVGTLPGAETVGSAVVALTDDGRLMATADTTYGIRLYSLLDPAAPVLVATLTGHTGNVETLDFNPAGTVLASGAADDTVRLWAVADPARPRALPALLGHAGQVDAVRFSSDGQRLASGDWTGAVRIWDTDDPTLPSLVTEFTGHREFITGLAFSPDAAVLATASRDDTVRLWNARGSTVSVPHGVISTGYSEILMFDPRGPGLFTGSGIQLWDLSGLATNSPLPEPGRALVLTRPGPDAAAMSSDGAILAAGVGIDGVRLWDTTDASAPRPAGRLPLRAGWANALAFGPRDRTLAVAGAHIGVVLVDVTDPRNPGPPRTVPITLPGQPQSISAVAISDDGSRLAVTTSAGFEVWNIAGWRDTAPTRVAAVADVGRVDTVAFARGAARLATAGEDGIIRVWDYGGGHWRRVATVSGHVGPVAALAYLPGGRMLASAGEDRTVRLWRTPTGAVPSPITTFAGHDASVRGLAVSADGHILASADDNGRVFLWQLDPSSLLAGLCLHSGPRITTEQWAVYVGDTGYAPPC